MRQSINIKMQTNLSDPFDCEYCDGSVAEGSACCTMNGGWYCSEYCALADNQPLRTHYRNGDERRLQFGNCDSCQCVHVNGMLCHEEGCPDAWRDSERMCWECGFDFCPTERWQLVCDTCKRYAEQYESMEDQV